MKFLTRAMSRAKGYGVAEEKICNSYTEAVEYLATTHSLTGDDETKLFEDGTVITKDTILQVKKYDNQ